MAVSRIMILAQNACSLLYVAESVIPEVFPRRGRPPTKLHLARPSQDVRLCEQTLEGARK